MQYLFLEPAQVVGRLTTEREKCECHVTKAEPFALGYSVSTVETSREVHHGLAMDYFTGSEEKAFIK